MIANLPVNLTVLFALLVTRRLALLLQLCLLCCLVTVDIYFLLMPYFMLICGQRFDTVGHQQEHLACKKIE